MELTSCTAFENAAMVVIALGGSINAALHLLAMTCTGLDLIDVKLRGFGV